MEEDVMTKQPTENPAPVPHVRGLVPLSDVVDFVANWWATEDGHIAMSPPAAAQYIEKHFATDAQCRHCNGKGYQAGDPEGAPIEDCDHCGGSGESTKTGEMKLFGHWSKHRLADGIFLPLVCYVPTGPDYTTVPLYAPADMGPGIDAIRGFLRRPRPDGILPPSPEPREGGPVDLSADDMETLRQEKINERRINIRNGYGD
jgi:hypothetical protein